MLKVGDELSRYKLEWVVTSSSPVVQFRAEWKMVGKKGEWQSEIVEVRNRFISPVKNTFLAALPFHPNLTFFPGEEGWSRELRR